MTEIQTVVTKYIFYWFENSTILGKREREKEKDMGERKEEGREKEREGDA